MASLAKPYSQPASLEQPIRCFVNVLQCWGPNDWAGASAMGEPARASASDLLGAELARGNGAPLKPRFHQLDRTMTMQVLSCADSSYVKQFVERASQSFPSPSTGSRASGASDRLSNGTEHRPTTR